MKNQTELDISIKKYLQCMRSEIRCPRNHKNRFVRQMEEEITVFIDEHDVNDIDDVINVFGTPKKLADDFMAGIGEISPSKSHKVMQKLLVALTAILAVLLALFCYHLFDAYNYTHGTFEDVVAEGTPPPVESNTQIY